MRIFELLLLIALSLTATVLFTVKQKKRRIILPLVAAVIIIFILHLIFEGLRWQMALAYLSPAIIFPGLILKRNGPQKAKPVLVSGFVLLILSVILLSLFPVHRMPEPAGPYKIGTISYELNDRDRREIYGPEPGTARRLKFQLWYPADSLEGGERTKWMTDGKMLTTGIPKMYGLPGFVLFHTSLIDSNSYKGIKVSDKEESFPLVIISHGWTGFMNLHSDLAEMLASYGFIAVSINHTYGAVVSVFDNGDVIYVDPEALPDRKSVDNFDSYSNKLVNTYALDAALVLDFLSDLNDSPGILENRINMDKVGVMGHSTGGGGVVQLAISDTRVKSVLGMDAWVEPVEPEILKKGLEIPACLLRSGQWETGLNNEFLKQLFSSSASVPDIYQINGCNHQDFSMLYMYDPMAALTGSQGSMDSRENALIQQDFVLTFFDKTLKDKDVDINMTAQKYKAVMRVKDFD
jgi:predicted dienelactone hydrolase